MFSFCVLYEFTSRNCPEEMFYYRKGLKEKQMSVYILSHISLQTFWRINICHHDLTRLTRKTFNFQTMIWRRIHSKQITMRENFPYNNLTENNFLTMIWVRIILQAWSEEEYFQPWSPLFSSKTTSRQRWLTFWLRSISQKVPKI